MNALILNGALAADQELDSVQETLSSELRALGHTARALVLRDTSIAFCLGCFGCWTETPGICRSHDAGRDVARAFIQSDVVFLLTPVTFGGYSSELKKGLDRIIGLMSPFFERIGGEVHHQKRYERYPRAVMIGALPEPCAEEETTFHALAQRNAINMHTPWYASRVLYRTASATEIDELLRATLAEMEGAA